MAALDQLAYRINSEHGLSHAYILAGADGEERRSVADYLSAAYVCSNGQKPCHNCSGCRKAAAHIHPDVITVAGEEGKDITVSQVRALRADAYVRPNEAPRKVYVIEEAQRMNIPAQNALLKVLEEGPPYASFLLLTANSAALLPTIVSRCETLRLAPGEGKVSPVSQAAREAAPILAEKLTGNSELARMEYIISLEKWKREELADLFDETAENLCARMGRENAKSLLPLVERLRAVRFAAEFNVGAGLLLGWLAGSVSSI